LRGRDRLPPRRAREGHPRGGGWALAGVDGRRVAEIDYKKPTGPVLAPLVEPLVEARRFVLSLGRFGRALGPKELVAEMRKEIRAMRKEYGAA
jgi:hypothetical protein